MFHFVHRAFLGSIVARELYLMFQGLKLAKYQEMFAFIVTLKEVFGLIHAHLRARKLLGLEDENQSAHIIFLSVAVSNKQGSVLWIIQ